MVDQLDPHICHRTAFCSFDRSMLSSAFFASACVMPEAPSLKSTSTSLTDARLCTIHGGSKDNAIPRECRASLAVADFEQAQNLLMEMAATIAGELSVDDRGVRVTVEECEPEAVMLTPEDTKRAITVLTQSRIGVLERSQKIAGLVECSRNLGVVRQQNDSIVVTFSARSSIEDQLDACEEELNLLAKRTGCTANHRDRYPGWDYAGSSKLREQYAKTYEAVTGRKAKVEVIHAGLECGIIHAHLPDMDMISVGPTIRDIHSPSETLDLASVEQFFEVSFPSQSAD